MLQAVAKELVIGAIVIVVVELVNVAVAVVLVIVCTYMFFGLLGVAWGRGL